MISWDNFYVFAIGAGLCWLVAAFVSLRKMKTTFISYVILGFQMLGLVILLVFIIGLSLRLERWPMKTMGEIRLWYVFFLSLTGYITYKRWHYRWILLFTTLMSVVFMIINVLRPELHHQGVMPALRSVWFVPHVIVYMLSYAFMACTFLIALSGLFTQNARYIHACDDLVRGGLSLFTIAMLLGAVWAKEAWGHYWTWDAKEIWAAVTWMCYLLYIHFRDSKPKQYTISYLILLFAFLSLQMCWYGVNIFPSLKENLHNYV